MNYTVFNDIIQNIHHQKIRDFTVACLEIANPELNEMPAASSGKYHPKECCEPGGLVKHIRRACFFANMLMQAYKFDAENPGGDVVYSALLLHDIAKKSSYKNEPQFAYVNHPVEATNIIKAKRELVPEPIFNCISNCVKFHMGPWTPKFAQKPMNQYTFLELMVYNCDFLSSRKELIIDVQK